MKMKPISLFLAFLSLAGLSTANQPPHFVQSILQSRQSNVPQFILDADHPWLASNSEWLSSYPDVKKAICTKDSALWTSPTTPSHAIPDDLFHRLTVGKFSGESRLGWANAADRLREMQNCTAALEDVNYLDVRIHVHDSPWYKIKEETLPPPELPGLFVDTLSRMHNLTRLDWDIKTEAALAFEPAFVERNLTFPNVKHLQPGAHSDYLISRCPNLETLVGGFWSGYLVGRREKPEIDLVRAATGLPVKTLKISSRYWSLAEVEELPKALPNLTTLHINGQLYDPEIGWDFPDQHKSMRYPHGTTLKRVISILKGLEHLEELILPDSTGLNLGFDGGAWCGNAYDGPDGREYGRSVVRDDIRTTEFAAGIVLAEWPDLKNFGFGNELVNLTLSDNGEAEILWPWTGRVEQYALEIWP